MGSASGSKGERFMMNEAPTEEYIRYCFVKCLTAPHAYIICCSVVAVTNGMCTVKNLRESERKDSV